MHMRMCHIVLEDGVRMPLHEWHNNGLENVIGVQFRILESLSSTGVDSVAPERSEETKVGGGGGGEALFVINGLPPPPQIFVCSECSGAGAMTVWLSLWMTMT